MYLVHGSNKYFLSSLFIMIALGVLTLCGSARAAGGENTNATVVNMPDQLATVTDTSTSRPDSSIEMSSSRDENGVRITMQSEMALSPAITQSSGRVIYKFKDRQLTGLNYINEALGADSLTARAVNDTDGTTITFNLPIGVKYNCLSQDGGKTLIFSVPNYILSLQTSDLGTYGERIVLTTVCPVKYTRQQTGDQVQLTLANTLQGRASSEYAVNSQYVDNIKLTANTSGQSGIVLNIATHNIGTVTFGISGSNNEINMMLIKAGQQQQQPVTVADKYEVVQEYISNNRPGTALSPTGQVVHATADPGATAQNIRDYFNNHPEAYASAHAVIDWNSIIEMIPENEIAWHAGPTANHLYLSFEMCQPAENDPNRVSEFQEVWNRAVWYCAKTCIKYGWNTNDNIFSHNGISQMYHETDHTDPYGYFAEYGKTWEQFLAAVDAEIAELGQTAASVQSSVN